jgi:non-heme chloroperoxidase
MMQRVGSLEAAVAGPTDTRTRPLTMVHGVGAGPWVWEKFQPFFAGRGYRSIALQLEMTAKHGGRTTLEEYAAELCAALTDIGDCFVIGHSMGGLLAQIVASRRRLAGVVLLASAPPWHMFRRGYGAMWRQILRHPLHYFLPALTGKPVRFDQEYESRLITNRLSTREQKEVRDRGRDDSGQALLEMALGLARVKRARITSPILVIGGSADRQIPASDLRRLAQRYDAPLRMFDRGHMLLLEDGWEEVAAAIFEWIEHAGARA